MAKSNGVKKGSRQGSASDVESEIARLASMTLGELRAAWVDRLGAPAPPVRSRDLLLKMMAWQIQAEAFGGLDAKTERKLREIAIALERDGTYEPKLRRDLAPGIILTREWKGAVHRVAVAADGFEYQDRRYKSLSDIARSITGTRWSGPRFFGLEQKVRRGEKRPS